MSCGGAGAGEGDGVSAAVKGGVVLSGEETGDPAGEVFASARCSGSSWAGKENAIVIKKNNAQ